MSMFIVLRNAHFWAFTQRIVVIHHRRFGTTYRYGITTIRCMKTQKCAFLLNSATKALTHLFINVFKTLPNYPHSESRDPAHTLPSYFFNFHFNIFLPKLGSSERYLSFYVLTKTLHTNSSSSISPTHRAHPMLHHPNDVLYGGVHATKLFFMHFSPPPCFFPPT